MANGLAKKSGCGCSRTPSAEVAHGIVLGGAVFILASWIAHCMFEMGPWPCQRSCACKGK